MVGRTRYRLPLSGSLKRKFDALAAELDLRVLASGEGGDGMFELVSPRAADGARFWAELSPRIARELVRFRRDAIAAQSAYEAAAALAARRLVGRSTPVLVDVHGDWRTSTRLYGSPHGVSGTRGCGSSAPARAPTSSSGSSPPSPSRRAGRIGSRPPRWRLRS